MGELHQPVMLKEVLAVLQPSSGESYLDLTAGYAGHADKILAVTQNYKDAMLVDRDFEAYRYLTEKYAKKAIAIVNQDFYSAALQNVECEKTFDMILADFGVSSPQLDQAERGFSFMHDGPLDMRMDRRQALTAEKIINHAGRQELVEMFVKYGEEKIGFARKIAELILQGRPWKTTRELADAIKETNRYSRMHPATRIFQAIRIATNDELGQIERTLPLMVKMLKPGGRLALITFHSLEDRIVKTFFKEQSSLGRESELIVLTKKPIEAAEMELVINPRSRSAKLRAAKRV